MAVVGLGVDLVDIRRFMVATQRTPTVVDRLFGDDEPRLSAERLAARFAAKEAAVKALGTPLRWRDIRVDVEVSGRPRIEMTGRAAQTALARGVRHWHVSLA